MNTGHHMTLHSLKPDRKKGVSFFMLGCLDCMCHFTNV
uniref:Uncharacterized protein n=1 Tax=Anguilla anguilla TaxID=7936 RepID=A0A0E9UEH3_ANGAN